MAQILRGAAKSQINLIDKSEYSAVVGANVVAIIGVFADGSVEKGNYISSKAELLSKLGPEVTRYNQGTKINYAHSAAYQALGTHSAMYVFRVTDGSEKVASFKPASGVLALATKNPTDRWNNYLVVLEKALSSQSSNQLYNLTIYDTSGKVLESHSGSLIMDAGDSLVKVINVS